MQALRCKNAVFMNAALAIGELYQDREHIRRGWKNLQMVCYLCRVGDNSSATSAEYSFKTGRAVGQFALPARIGLIADLGITSNSSVSLQHLATNKPEIALFVGGVKLLDVVCPGAMSALPIVAKSACMLQIYTSLALYCLPVFS